MEENKVPGEKRDPIIQVKNLYKIYKVGDTKVYALNGVDFNIYKGEFCAVSGSIRIGKINAVEYACRPGKTIKR